MTDKLDINLRIGSEVMTITINRSEEQLLRDVAQEVNHVYRAYAERFPKSSEAEVMAKVTLLFAKGYLTMAHQSEELESVIQDFENDLDRLLEAGS